MHHTAPRHADEGTADTTGPVVPPDDLLAAGDRRAQARTLAQRTEARQRTRRRILPAALAGASVLALAGAADRFVAGTVPAVPAATTGVTPTAGAASPAPSTGTSAATLNRISQTLAADRRAITALAQAQAALARSAGGDSGGGTGGDHGGSSGGAPPSVSLPSLPALPSASSLSVPAAAPTTHATTGASVVVP